MRWLQRLRGKADVVYKTGDLVRLLPTGPLKYIGRKDLQVKVHGQRIELGEVEHHVHRLFPQAANIAAEVLHPNKQQGTSILTAFLEVPHLQELSNGHTPSMEMRILRATAPFLADVQSTESKLRDMIPPYMIPTLFLPVNHIALTPSGKVNRRMLQSIGSNLSRQEIKAFINQSRSKRAPETKMQQALVMLCAKVLNLPPDGISIDDSFLALGGDSISAMSLVARASMLQISMAVADVLAQTTIEKLALRVKNTAIQFPRPSEELDVPFALSPIQQMFFEVVPQESRNHYNQSFFVSLATQVSAEKLEAAVSEMTKRHVMLRARFSQDDDGRWTQRITTSTSTSKPESSYLFRSHGVPDVASIEPHAVTAQQSLNIECGPLLAVDLYQVHNQGQYILLVAHHLVIDHVSWRIILSDLEEYLEESLVSIISPTAPEPSLPFQTWCHLQAQHVREHLPPQKAHPASEEGHGASPTSTALMDYWGLTGRSNTCSDVASIGFTLGAEVTESLLGKANDALRTKPVEIMQAALMYSFMNQFSDRDPPIVHSESHGREVWDSSTDLSRTVGWFTTIWPTPTTVLPAHGLIEVVKRTKDSRRQVRSNGWAYFASRFLHPEGRSRLPLDVPLEIVFNYAGSFQQLEQRQGLFHTAETQFTQFDAATTATRFELFEVSAVVKRGQLQVEISYHHAMPQDRIRQWGSSFEAALCEASVTLPSIQKQFTLADFPLLQIGYSDLEFLVEKVAAVTGVHDKTEIEDAYPCSSIQQGMLLSQAKDAAQYITSTTWDIQRTDGIDIDRFIRSWYKVVDHNPILRTIFVESRSGQLWDQVVLNHSAGDVILLDPDSGTNSPALQKSDSVTASRPWQLIVARSGDSLFCELRILHALMDGFSTHVLEQQLAYAYEDQAFSGPVATLKDYISYVQDLPSGAATKFWATYLEGSDHCILPTLNHTQDVSYEASAAHVTRKLDNLQPLHTFCGENGVTLFNLVQLAWGLVLRAFTASDAVCFGYLVTGRNMPISGMDEAIGPFINILISRMNLDGSNSIADVVQSIHSDFLQGLGHQHTSLAEIYHSLGISGRGLFNTVVSLQNKSEEQTNNHTPGLSMRTVNSDDPTEYDLTLNIAASKDEMEFALWYYENSFTPSQVHDLAAAFERALLSSVTSANVKVRDVDLLSEDHIQWLHLRNKVLPEARQECIHEAIEPFFISTPSAQAVCAWDGDFSYAELDQLSSRLSRLLIHHGVEPETYVTIHYKKSRWTSVAMLAVLRAGGAFTLLDPSLPLAQKQIICADLGCQIMISSTAVDDVSSLVREVIMIGDDEDKVWAVPSSESILPSQVQPTHAAYAVFTSGSTGKPKGVVIDHSSFCTSATAQHQSLSIDSSTRVLQFSAYTWDVSIMDQLATFMAGGCVCIPSEAQRVNALGEAIQQYGANWIHTTPPVVRLLDPDQVSSLQVMTLIGESPSYDDIKMWRGRVSLRETFGPTECSVLAMVNPDLSSDPRNIGRESGCICWIVDPEDHNKLAAVGAIGELLIEGPILGRGYLNDPLKTSAAFIENPAWAEKFRAKQTVRLYKTGDLVYYCSDGSIRFYRRKDTQVKLRGQRIEPGEVEHHISNSFDGAERVVVDVLALESETSRSFLVAFIKCPSLDDSNDVNVAADLFAPPSTAFSTQVALTQTLLQSKLPKHMVPTIFLPLNEVPLTAACKTDRRLLKRKAAALTRGELEIYMHAGASAKQTPTTEMEHRLQTLCANVLNLAPENIGTNDDFFHLGGDSISAMQLVFQCRRMGISLGMEDVFRHRTLAGIASHARNEQSGAIALAMEKIDEPFSLSAGQQLFFRFSPQGCDNFNHGFVMKITQKIETDRLQRAIRTIVERHSMIRARFSQDCHGSWTQRITSQTNESYLFQQIAISGESELTHVLQNAQECVSIQHGPVLVAYHVQLDGQEDDCLILVAHRLVVDLASWRIILSDLETVLSQKDPLPVLTPVSMSFQSWCSLQADSIAGQSPTRNGLLPQPREQIPEISSLDFWGMIGRPNQVKHSNTVTSTIDHSTTAMLYGRANRAFRTQPAEILHAALVHSFLQIFVERDPPVMYDEGYNRQFVDGSIDISQTVGSFSTIHPTPVHIDNRDDLVEMVRRTKDAHRSFSTNGRAHINSRSKDSSDLEGLPEPFEIIFNFEGLKDHPEDDNSILQVVRSRYANFQAPHISPEAPRFALINVWATVLQGELVTYFTFNQQMKHGNLLRLWVDEYQKSITRAVIDLSHASLAYSLSDFPLLTTTYEGLDTFVARVRDQTGLQEGESIIDNAYPCSPIQRGILLSKLKDGDLYSPRFTWKLQVAGNNPVDLRRLREGWKRVLERHPVFRTVFVQSSSHMEYYSQAVMVSTPDNITTLQSDDEDVIELIRDYRSSRIQRDQNALWHLVLCQGKTGDAFCDLKVSHALIDGTSIAVLTREVQLAYDSMLSAGVGPPYSDYIRYLQSTPADAIIDYWKKKLSSISPCIFPQINNTRSSSSVGGNKRELRCVELEIDDASTIYRFCRQYGFTISNILQVAWALILQCYTASEFACFAYVTSGRDAPVSNIEGAVGPFINVLINHMYLNPDIPLLDVLRANQDANIENLKYQNCSLAEIFHAMSLGAGELFNSSMSVQNRSSDYDSSGSSFAFSVLDGEDRTEYDITLHALVDRQGISLSLDYWKDELISAGQADRLLRTMREAVVSIAAYPKVNIGQVGVLSPEDQLQLHGWNEAVPTTLNCCVHDLIERHFQCNPSSLAVHSWDGDLSYQDLDRLSSRLAAQLVYLGAQPETFIPLLFEGSMWAVVSVLAVMRSGAAFVLLDPASPASRLEQVCAQAKVKIILSSTTHKAILHHLPVHLVVVDREAECLWPFGVVLPSNAKPQTALSAILTAESTGKLNGLVVDHASFCSAVEANKVPLRIDSNTRMFQFSSHASDTSIGDQLMALTQGGCVCIPSASQLKDVANAICSLNANWVSLTPSVARRINPSRVPSLKTVYIGGEPTTSLDVARWKGFVHLAKGYGPAEFPVRSTIQPNALDTPDPRDIGVGTGVACWIVDASSHQRLLPPGATGELLLQGPILGRGYLGCPEQGNTSFIEAPIWLEQFRPSVAGQLYKTGELVRYQPDGSILYMGRKNTQAKIQGQRLELEEIARHIQNYFPHDKDVVVDVIRPGNGDAKPILAAFISHSFSPVVDLSSSVVFVGPSTAFQIAVLTAQTHLQEILPPFKVPSAFLPVEGIPLSVMGKVDRKLLREAASNLSQEKIDAYINFSPSDHQGRIPTSELEQLLQTCIARVLNKNLSHIGLDDNFFRFGGDSISAMMLVSQCRQQGMAVTVADIFRHKTIRRLASHIQSTKVTTTEAKETVGTVFDLSPIQQALFDRVPEGVNNFSQSFLVKLRQPMESVEAAIATIVRRHTMLRARFRKEAGVWVQMVSDDIEHSYRYRNLTCSITETKKCFVESQTALDFMSGPLLMADQITVGKNQYLFLAAHHLVIDIVSWRIILNDLEALLAGESLPPLCSLPFQVWCRLQAEYAKKHLMPSKTLPLLASIPDFELDIEEYWGLPKRSNIHADVVSTKFTIDPHVTKLLLGPANKALQTKPIELLHAAILLSFVKSFPVRPPPIIYQEGHGREPWNSSVDVSGTVGWFTTVWPALVRATVDSSFMDVARLTKDIMRQTQANGWSYFAARYLHPEGSKRLTIKEPVEILVNYHGCYHNIETKDTNLQVASDISNIPLGVDPQMPRGEIFDIEIWGSGDTLEFDFTYSKHSLHQTSIKEWVSACQTLLTSAAEELYGASRRYTLDDFPQLPPTSPELSQPLHNLRHIGVDPASVQEAYPCSPVQQGILLSQGRSTELYTTRTVWKVSTPNSRPPISINEIQHAWAQIVMKHSALRTIITESPSSDRLHDLLVIDHAAGKVIVLDSVDSTQEPIGTLPWQFIIKRGCDAEILCELAISHSLVDGISIRVLGAELSSTVNGKPLDYQAMPYKDYISYLNSVPRQQTADYWREYLSDSTPTLFPSLNDSSEGQLHFVTRCLDARRIKNFCKTYGSTLSNVIQLAWALVLRCYTGTDDVCFGYLASGRDIPLSGIENAVGLFINLLVCRLQLDSNLSMLSILQSNESNFIRSLEHQHCSLAEIQHDLGLKTEPLFNSIISYQAVSPMQAQSLDQAHGEDALAVVETVGGEDPTEYGLVINVDASSDRVNLSLTFWSNLLDPEQGSRLCDILVQTILNITDNPSTSVGDIDLVSREELNIIRSWNAQLPQAEEVCVHELILDQCRAYPQAPAVCAWDGNFNYEELNQLSTKLAAKLQILGVGPETFVPLLFEKSKWVSVAIWAVMRAGGAFILLDDSYPEARLREICETSRCPLVISSSSAFEKAAPLTKRVVVVSQSEAVEWTSNLETPLQRSVLPRNALYGVFTSGSTGKSKGVVIEHSSYATSGLSLQKRLRVTNQSRVFQFASHAFDVSISDYLTTFIAGGCICVPSETDRINDIPHALRKLDANWMHITPSVAQIIHPSQAEGIKLLVLSGEAIKAENIKTWGHSVHLINAYGPAECSVDCVVNDRVVSGPSSIGYASGAACWVTDKNNPARLLPIGAVGELLVEGPIVGRGYLHNEEQSSRAFIERPLWLQDLRGHESSPRHVYRTGDLVQYLPDGSLKYVGRRDNQVKMHGQRVELGEVESHLRRLFPGSQDVAAEILQRPDVASQKVLAAFIRRQAIDSTGEGFSILEPSQEFLTDVHIAESRLLQNVPRHMVPTMFIAVNHIPLSRSGKVDRSKLRGQAAKISRTDGGSDIQHTVQRPLTKIERRIQLIVSRVLGLSQTSSAWTMGGDSVTAMQLVSLARHEGLLMTVRQIFILPVLADIAREVQQSTAELNLKASVVESSVDTNYELLRTLLWADLPFRENEVVDVIPTTDVQTFSANRPQNYWFLELSGPLDAARLKQACSELIEKHSILRTAFVPHAGRILQIILRKLSLDVIECDTDQKDLRAFGEAYGRRDFTSQSLYGAVPLALTLVKSDNEHHLLIMRLSHAQYDGLSIPKLMANLLDLYHQQSISVAADFATYVRHCTRSHNSDTFAFWRSLLDGSSMTSLFNQPAATGASNDSISSALVESEAIVPLPTPPPGITLATVVKTAWAMVQSKLLRRSDLVFGQLVSGRNTGVVDLEDVIGPCINYIPVRVQIHPKQTISELLKQVQAQHVKTMPFETVGLQEIVKNSTSWPPETDFGSIVHHRFSQDQSALDSNELSCQIDAWSPLSLPAMNIWVSTIAEKGRLSINIFTRSEVASQAQIDRLMEEMSATLTLCREGVYVPTEDSDYNCLRE
ncbi:NRPS [Arthroderma sp. PD_2]|nr:NRPS [Arthroderma sp. PD_2]